MDKVQQTIKDVPSCVDSFARKTNASIRFHSLQSSINALSNQLYKWGLVTDTTNRYDLPSDEVIDFVNKSSWDIEIDKKKLIYYTRHFLLFLYQCF